jgi:hypothetical protein
VFETAVELPRTVSQERATAVRIACITAAGFLFSTVGPTYMDPRLKSHVVWGARSYPLGYAIAVFVPIFFFVTYFSMRKFGTMYTMLAWLPFAVLMFPFLWYFKPEFPHAGVLFGIVGYAFLAFLTAFLENAVMIPPEVAHKAVPRRAKIRRLEEAIKDWRAILFISATTYVVVIIYWLQMLWQVAGIIVTDPAEKFLFGNAMVASVLYFSLFVVTGPIWSLFKGLKNHQIQLFELEAAEWPAAEVP